MICMKLGRGLKLHFLDRILKGIPNLIVQHHLHGVLLKQDDFLGPWQPQGFQRSDAFCIASAFAFVRAYEANECGREMCALYTFAMNFLLGQRVSYGFAMICLNKDES